MTFDAIWSEHRRFILVALGCTAAFFIADSILGSVFFSKAKSATQRESRLAQTLRSRKVPTRADLDLATKQRDQLKARFDELRSRLEFRTAPEYVLPPDNRDFDLFYNRVFQKTREELVESAGALDIEIDPSLGLPDVTPATIDEARDALRAIDLVKRVCRAAIDARVRAVREIRAGKAGSPGSRASAAVADAPFVRETEAAFTVEGSASALVLFLDSIQRPGSPFLIREAHIEVDKKNTQLARAEVKLVGLQFVVEEDETSPRAPRSTG